MLKDLSKFSIVFPLALWSINVMGLSLENIEKAKKIPSQSSLGVERSWSCGPNSLARFFALSGYDFLEERDTYIDFMNKCPRSFGKPTTTKGYLSCASAAAASICCLGYGWDGYSDVLCGLALGAMASTPFIIESINKHRGVGKVGPTPIWLAGYGNQFLAINSVERKIVTENFTDEDVMMNSIKKSLDRDEPVLVLINYAPLAWHYINIVRFDERSNIIHYLETDGVEYSMSLARLFALMDFDKAAQTKAIKWVLENFGSVVDVNIGRFNLIRWEVPTNSVDN